MIIFSSDKSELMNVRSLERDGDNLIIKGKVMGAMPMKAVLTPEQARSAFKLLDFKTALFLLTLLFRRTKPKQASTPGRGPR